MFHQQPHERDIIMLSPACSARALFRRFTLGLIASALMAAVVIATPYRALASSNGDPIAFTVTAISSNTSGHVMFIDNTHTNGQPHLNIQVTQVWPNNWDAHPIGVWYSTSGEWTVFNEDGADIPLSTSFNISVHDLGDPYFQVTATSSTIVEGWMYISNGYLDKNPYATLWVTQVWTGTFNPHTIGVWYDNSRQQWAIFNEDHADMPAGSTFNYVIANLSNNFYAYTHFATPNTIISNNSDMTFIDDPALNGQPDLFPQVTQVWNVQGSCGCVYDNHPIGVFYSANTEQWAIYNVDRAMMPVGAAFFVSAI
jgi:hypothetical protein